MKGFYMALQLYFNQLRYEVGAFLFEFKKST